jgi:hypothetical protein
MGVLTERRQAWVNELVNGDREQTTGFLHVLAPSSDKRCHSDVAHSSGYCCLGVACDLMPRVERGTQSEHGPLIETFDGSSAFLPDRVCEYYGMYSPQGGYEAPVAGSLSERNDGGASFKQIAETIVYHQDELFTPDHDGSRIVMPSR